MKRQYTLQPFSKEFFRLYDFTLPWLLERIPPSARVLVVGCGNGYLANILISRSSISELVAFDIDPIAVTAATTLLSPQRATILNADAESPNLHKILGTFDVVVVRNTFHHFKRKLDFLLMVRDELLRSGGNLLLLDLDSYANFFAYGLGVYFTLFRALPYIGLRSAIKILKETNFFQKKNIRIHRRMNKDQLKRQGWYKICDIREKTNKVLDSAHISRIGDIFGLGGCYTIHFVSPLSRGLKIDREFT